ncbi:MAG: glutamate-ammonia-ligase adenylyltransferase [Cellvibrionaceae bacterium]|jgi:glutamate-ammonia-ligase adenylyltransferase
MSISRNFSAPQIPQTLQEWGLKTLKKFEEGLSETERENLGQCLEQTPMLAIQLTKALLGSEYLLESCLRNPDLLFQTLLVDAPYHRLTRTKIIDATEACCDSLSPGEFSKVLRQLRNRLITILYWRDLNGLADLDEVIRAMTAMAEAFVQRALDYHYRQLIEKHGLPMGKDSGQIQPMLVIGMGKLGGSELNVSSDIDLIFVFPEAGTTNHPHKTIDNQQFFTKLGQCLIKTLHEITIDGFVFRVDMRLRPYGQSGALTSNFNALQNYYETQGRDWERFAAVKARVIACTKLADHHQSMISRREASETLHKILQPFVYRNYVDFFIMKSMRKLKALMTQEVKRKGLEEDLKLGAGGIREIEFIAQCFQLIHGGHNRQLQEKNLLKTLTQLQLLGYLEKNTVQHLSDAYIFLRNAEHAIQAFADAQTQMLPSDDLSRERLAWTLDFDSWSDFYRQLQIHRERVIAEFRRIVAEPEERHPNQTNISPQWQKFWMHPDDQGDFLSARGFKTAAEDCAVVAALRQSRNVLNLSPEARQNLDKVVPILMQALANYVKQHSTNDDRIEEALPRVFSWLEATVNRTSYLLLMLENPDILKLLVKLLAASTWVTETLKQMPSLLEELLYPQSLLSLPERNVLRDELRQRLLLDAEDREAHMETLRYFRLAHSLKVAACEITGGLPLMKVSDYLTFTAETVLEQVLELAMRDITAHHGYPEGAIDETPQFLIVGYGKLGGIEMNYSSDLDLVFIYREDPQSITDGERPLDAQTYYTRLGQKIIHILNTHTLSGPLYKVDMRLRPSGKSGLLVTSLKSFQRYQDQDAWTWEHQALVRARPVTGSFDLAMAFNRIRQEVLCKKRNLPKLRKAVVAMRDKMRQQLGSGAEKIRAKDRSGKFNIKQDPGGIVDIEFMVQYAVLAWSHQDPDLAKWTDNIRILDSLRYKGFIQTQQSERLNTIYQSYRKYKHQLALQQENSDFISNELFVEERKWVTDIWHQYLLD